MFIHSKPPRRASTVCVLNESVNCFRRMTFTPVLHVQAKRKKKEEAANAKILEAEKRNKVNKMTFKNKTVATNLRLVQKLPQMSLMQLNLHLFLMVCDKGRLNHLYIITTCIYKKSFHISSTAEV